MDYYTNIITQYEVLESKQTIIPEKAMSAVKVQFVDLECAVATFLSYLSAMPA